jgi:2-phosphoglycolate phosphatase
MGRPVQAVLFDLDGTLVDSAPDLANALRALCHSVGHPIPDFQDWQQVVPEGTRAMLEYAFGSMENAELTAHAKSFVSHYEENCFVDSTIYGSMVSVLEALQASELALGVVTNKAHRLAERVLHGSQLHGFFRTLVGGDTTPAPKPSPMPVLAACNALGLNADQVLLIGDDERDRQAANAAGAAFIHAKWGYGLLDPSTVSMGDVVCCAEPTGLINTMLEHGWL